MRFSFLSYLLSRDIPAADRHGPRVVRKTQPRNSAFPRTQKKSAAALHPIEQGVALPHHARAAPRLIRARRRGSVRSKNPPGHT